MLRRYDTRSLIAKGLLHLIFLETIWSDGQFFSLFNGKLAFSFSLNRHKVGPLTIIQRKKMVAYERSKVY